MNIKELLNKRKTLLEQAEGCVNEGNTEQFNAIEAEIKELDNEIEKAKLVNANLKALQDNQTIIDLENKTQTVEGEKEMTKFNHSNVLDTENLYVNAFAKTLMGKELTQEENNTFLEMNNHTTGNTAVVIPQTTLNEIISEIEATNPFFADARKMNVKGTITIPKHTAIASGDAKGYLESEETEVEKNTFVEIQLGAKEVAKYLEVSFKLEAMSIPAFMAYLKAEIVERLGVELGRQAVNGDGGTKEMQGVLTAMKTVTAQNVTYTTNIEYTNLTNAISKIGSQHVSKAVIYASNDTVWNQLANILDNNGRPLFIPDVTSGGVGRILGLPVKVDTAVPAGTLLVGNAKGYLVNTQEAVQVESDRNIKARKTGFSAYTILDGKVTHEKAFVVLTPTA